MRLIIEQLKNQDPMNPLNSGEFTTQLAQINSLEQLINMNTLMEQFIGGGKLADATALIGRYVEGMDANGTSIAGTVESVEVIDGVPSLKIGDQLLLPSQVVTVSDKAKG
jgi:flagellar basal-body rod modification protein FlgD